MFKDQSTASVLNILVVEDDESTGDVIVTAIAQETPYTTQVVTTGIEALQAVKKMRPDLIILDYRLPDTTGVELYDQFQAMQELVGIPTILMSASKHREDIELRNLVLLDKPFELDEFIMTIKQLLVTGE